jgi:hypothetical protein
MLFNLCKTYDKKYRKAEKECLNTVKKLRPQFTPVFSYEKLLIKVIDLKLFPLYKLYTHLKFKI